MVWRMRPEAPTSASRWILTFLSVTVPVAVLGLRCWIVFGVGDIGFQAVGR